MEKNLKLSDRFAYSLFKFDTYKIFIEENLSKAILYLLIMSSILSLFVTFKFVVLLNDNTSTMKNILTMDFPDFNIQNGKFHVDSTKPFIYKIDNNTVCVLDNNTTTSQDRINNYEDAVLVTSDKVIIKAKNKIQLVIPMKSFQNINRNFQNMDKNKFINYLDLNAAMSLFYLFIFVPIFLFLGKLFSAFILIAPVAYSINKTLNTNINYKKACIIAIYSLSLPALLKTLLFLSGYDFNGSIYIYYAIAFTCCNLALNSIKNIQNSNINTAI